MKSKRTIACSISPETRKIVEERDGHKCIFCGSFNCRGEAHYIRRSQGGLGIPENILCVCRNCHYQLDESQAKALFRKKAEGYLKSIYPDWDEKKLVFKKG